MKQNYQTAIIKTDIKEKSILAACLLLGYGSINNYSEKELFLIDIVDDNDFQNKLIRIVEFADQNASADSLIFEEKTAKEIQKILHSKKSFIEKYASMNNSGKYLVSRTGRTILEQLDI